MPSSTGFSPPCRPRADLGLSQLVPTMKRTRTRSVAVPTGRLAALIVCAAIPLLALQADRWILVPVAVALVLVAGFADAASAVHPSDIDVERDLPGAVTVGEPATLVWRVRSRSGRAGVVTVSDAMWPSFDASRRSSTFRLDGGGVHRFSARVEPSRRGRFPFGAVTVRTRGPLGLMSRQATRDVPGSIGVMPAYPSRDLMRTRMRIPLDSGIRSVRARGTGTDFDQLREYRQGDDVRRLDWAATARTQTAVVRDYRSERNQFVIALLDNGRTMAGTVSTPVGEQGAAPGDVVAAPRVEHAMDAVLGLTQVAGKLGDNVGLLTFDSQVRGIVPARHSTSQMTKIAEAMYLLDPSLDESAYRVAFDTAASRFRRRALFVVFTDLVDTVVENSLLPALTSLTRTHLVMVAAVRDPDVAAWASQSGHQHASEAFRSAAAVATISARERTIARLTAAGAIVVDARPGDLAVDVVDKYLELKTTGRL